MTEEQAQRAIEIAAEIKTIKSDIWGLDFQENFSSPTQLFIGGITKFFSNIFGSRPSEHLVTNKEETIAVINFLQDRRREKVKWLEIELKEL